jgi:AbrB family looped-hinge helix DNA binding protein
MKVSSRGQVTIPAHLRERCGLHEGDEVDVIEEDGTLRIVRTDFPSVEVIAPRPG